MIEDIEITNFRCFDRIKFIHDYLIKVFPEAALLDRVNVITLSDRY